MRVIAEMVTAWPVRQRPAQIHAYRLLGATRCLVLIFAFSLPFRPLSRYPAGMPAPERNHVQVVRCKGIGCGRNVLTPVEIRVRTGSITVLCPVCLERRSYIVSTEVFMGSPSWEVMRVLQGRKRNV